MPHANYSPLFDSLESRFHSHKQEPIRVNTASWFGGSKFTIPWYMIWLITQITKFISSLKLYQGKADILGDIITTKFTCYDYQTFFHNILFLFFFFKKHWLNKRSVVIYFCKKLYLRCLAGFLTHFVPLVSFYAPWKQ